MADTKTTTTPVMSLIATKSSRVKDLTIKNGQLIFVQDAQRIAFDFNNNRVFYNQITELSTEGERIALIDPLPGYYFIIDTAVLWRYQDGWIQITDRPSSEAIFIGVELPELGQAKESVLYINKTAENISVYDSASNDYLVVADRTKEVTDEDINSLFN